MTRFSRVMPVYFVEEPAFEGDAPPHLAVYHLADRLTVLVPHLPAGMTPDAALPQQRQLLAGFFEEAGLVEPVLWFYTPAALRYADELPSACVVYDCMDELAAFQDAAPDLARWEATLLDNADVVFTGGRSLYEAKRNRHHNIHAFPSAVDVAHFARARTRAQEPPDQSGIPHPRFGFFGAIDERLDRELITTVAQLRPQWQLIFVGPVVKIDPQSLPQAANIHYLGRKLYSELPDYIAGWDVAMMPFAINGATRFISPTKTAEYLAAGKPVLSTAIADVVHDWGHLDRVRIAADVPAFIDQAEAELSLPRNDANWLESVDRHLVQLSWDDTWCRMAALIAAELELRPAGRSRQAMPSTLEERPAPGASRV